MNVRSQRSSPPRCRPAMVALALMLAIATVPLGAQAEIPHENYDLASSDLDTVVAMLNSSIRSFEASLRALNDQDTTLASQYMERVDTVLQPAEEILNDIQNLAGSYVDLSYLLPPFTALYDSESDFLEMEIDLLDARDDIVSSSELLNLTDEQLIAALDAIERFNSIADQMNSTVDEMLVHARTIDGLTVDGEARFVPNELVELIEQLREMMVHIIADISAVIQDDIPWDDNFSFLLIWVTDTNLYLGEHLAGGGYLFINGTFVGGHAVNVSMDGYQLLSSTTDATGRYAFSWHIPLNASWLGSHMVSSRAYTVDQTVDSDPIQITISLIPTSFALTATANVLAPEDQTTLAATLKDVRGNVLPQMNCSLTVDGEDQGFVTDDAGTEEWTMTGADIGYGVHAIRASYQGVLPYASSSSRTITITVDIPTNITVNLFSDRLRKEWHLVGNGTLTSNSSQPMPARNVSLFVDGEHVLDAKTQADGTFAFSISTDNITAGAHTLKAAFVLREDIWRYSEAEASFVIISWTYADYPFFPWIPGWDIGLGDQIPYLFFGENAYYTWMFIVLVIGIVIKTIQVRKARRAGAEQRVLTPVEVLEKEETEAAEDKVWMPERAPDWLSGPNEKVVWHYARMISFLKDRRRVGITDNMTHWEVARLLLSLGYPLSTTTRVTVMFEKAYYSGTSMSEADVIQMGSSAHTIKRTGGARPAG